MDKSSNQPTSTNDCSDSSRERTTITKSNQSSSSSSTTSSPPRYSDNVPCALPRYIHAHNASGTKVRKMHKLNNNYNNNSDGRINDTELDAHVVSVESANSSSNNLDELELESSPVLATTTINAPIPPPRHTSPNTSNTTICNSNGITVVNNNNSNNSKILVNRHHKGPAMLTATKEEKQRQNEEIVTMESSSISSETGSCETVNPRALNLPAAIETLALVHNFDNTGDMRLKTKEIIHSPITAEPCCLSNNITMGSLAARSGCFIDASSLIDEDEVPSFQSTDEQQLDETKSNNEILLKIHNVDLINKTSKATVGDDDDDDEDNDDDNKKLVTFQKCNIKYKNNNSKELKHKQHSQSSSSSSASDADSPQKMLDSDGASNATNTNNLSDEEKLWKRDHITNKLSSYSGAGISGGRDQSNPLMMTEKDDDPKQQLSTCEDVTEASVSLAAEIDSSDSSEIIKHRSVGLNIEQKRKPGIYAMHQIQPFSIHPLSISPKFNTFSSSAPLNNMQSSVTAATTNNTTVYSDMSYTTDYSSSSPAPSLVWSEHENRPFTVGNIANSGNGIRHSGDYYDGHMQSSKTTSHLPETPHNSIVHIESNNNASNASSIHRDYTLSSSLSHQRDSGAYCSDATDSPVPLPRTPRRSKCDESNVIVSGGASIEDHALKPCDSPSVRRRLETCPIVSGGFVSLDFEQRSRDDEVAGAEEEGEIEEEVELRVKPKTRKPISGGVASWVVDMSDCRISNSSSDTNGDRLQRERSDSTSSQRSVGHRSCGFYVGLADGGIKPSTKKSEDKSVPSTQLSKSYTSPKSAGFFVNLSQSETHPKYTESQEFLKEAVKIENESTDKKQIFSLFIDIGVEKKPNARKEVPVNLAQRFNASSRGRSEEPMKSSTTSSTETLMSKSSHFNKAHASNLTGNMDIERQTTENHTIGKTINEPPLTVAALRRNAQQRRQLQNDSSKRHSWGDHDSNKEGTTSNYKRSISLTNTGNENNGLMCIIDKLPLISNTTRAANDSSMSPCTGSISELASSNSKSNLSLSSVGDDDNIKSTRVKLRQRDAQINQTYDKSSLASINDSLLSKDLSPNSTTDTDDLTFQQDEELAIRETIPQTAIVFETLTNSNRASAQIMETIIETKESSPKKLNMVSAAGHTMETLHATIEKQKMLLETVNENSEVVPASAAGCRSSFVKLSDLDKPVKNELQSPETFISKSMSGSNYRQFQRMYRDENKGSGRPHSWTMTRSTGHSLLNITNSVDNLRSLTRLFPHFSNEITNSLPNDMILDNLVEYAPTDISGDSSMASSFSRSAMDESSMSCRQPRRLGEDLLKMFLQEIATDMIVEVHGRRIRAHKCILRSRCQYFAAMLAGHENQHTVSLQGYSYSAVHFALCHIYSGASHPPDGISLMELAALADLLGLEGLKEVTAHALKINYCHNFHKPCSGCIDGILQVFPVALNHALDDLYRKCLRWTCRHYLKVWTSRQFSQLPPDILGRCRQQIVAYLTSETVLDTMLDCDNLLIQVSSCSWGGMCENLVRDILDAAHNFIAEHFASLIASDSFLSLGHDRSCHIPHLEGILIRIASSLNADQACRSYQRVTRLNTVLQANALQLPENLGDLAKELQGLQEEDLDWDPEYIRLVSALLSAVEQCLIRQCSRAMRVTAWQRMDLNLRKKIQTLAHLSEPLDMKRVRAVQKNFSINGGSRSQDLYQVKLAIQAHSRKANVQDQHMFQASHTYTQTIDPVIQTIERGVQANSDAKFSAVGKILKSNSRAYVPQSFRHSDGSGTHKRTQSSEGAFSSNNNNHSNNNMTSTLTAHHHRATSVESAKLSSSNKITDKKKPQQLRLVDVRPRYLEPRKLHNQSNNITSGPVRSATSSCIPSASSNKCNKIRQLSSSDSSRHSSPATRKGTTNNRATTTATTRMVKDLGKSTHISLDSLASPSKQKTKSKSGSMRSKLSDNDRYSDIGMDSMAESMRSSIITNKTVSQESLKNMSVFSRSNPIIMGNKQHHFNNNHNIPNRNNNNNNRKQLNARQTHKGFGLKTTKNLSQQHLSTGSSPSSIATSKSATSRLSSVSSTQSSRNLYKHRSISVPGQTTSNNNYNTTSSAGAGGGGGGGGITQRFSFLSAKSREILAKRAEKNKFQQQQHQDKTLKYREDNGDGVEIRVPMRSASTTNANNLVMMANRSSLPTNIPMRRPNTLHIKKTNSFNYHNKNADNKTTAAAVAGQNKQQQQQQQITKHNKNKESIDEDLGAGGQKVENEQEDSENGAMIRSTLQRSSTFCKDSPALNINQLQIIE